MRKEDTQVPDTQILSENEIIKSTKTDDVPNNPPKDNEKIKKIAIMVIAGIALLLIGFAIGFIL